MHSFYARIVDNIVVDVIAIPREATWNENGVEDDTVGVAYCNSLLEAEWVRTYPDVRKHKWFAGVGFTWRPDLDAFVPPQPHPDCTLDEEHCHWIAPDGTNVSVPSKPRSTP
jgi:hypothetical protein